MAITASAFAALTAVYHILATVVKILPALIKAAGVKQIPHTFSFNAIKDNLLNAGQALALTPVQALLELYDPINWQRWFIQYPKKVKL